MDADEAHWAVDHYCGNQILGILERFFNFSRRSGYKRDPCCPKCRDDIGVLHYTYENMEQGAVELLYLAVKQEDGKWYVTWVHDMRGRGYLHLMNVAVEEDKLVISYYADGKPLKSSYPLSFLLKPKKRGVGM